MICERESAKYLDGKDDSARLVECPSVQVGARSGAEDDGGESHGEGREGEGDAEASVEPRIASFGEAKSLSLPPSERKVGQDCSGESQLTRAEKRPETLP